MKSVGSNSQGTGNDEVTVQEPNANITQTQADQQGKSTLTSSAGATVNNCGGSSPIGGIQVGVKNLMHDVKTINARLGEGTEFARDAIKKRISSATQDITGKASNLASGMVNDTFNKLGPLANAGMGGLYSSVNAKITAATGNPAIGHLAGVASQVSMAAPLQLSLIHI